MTGPEYETSLVDVFVSVGIFHAFYSAFENYLGVRWVDAATKFLEYGFLS
jgi:hypothetical protein